MASHDEWPLNGRQVRRDGSNIDEKPETWQTNLKFQGGVALLRYVATWRYEALREATPHYQGSDQVTNQTLSPKLVAEHSLRGRNCGNKPVLNSMEG